MIGAGPIKILLDLRDEIGTQGSFAAIEAITFELGYLLIAIRWCIGIKVGRGRRDHDGLPLLLVGGVTHVGECSAGAFSDYGI